MTTSPLAVAALLASALAWRVRRPRQWALASCLVGLLCVNLWRPVLRPWVTLDLAAFIAFYALTAGLVWRALMSGPFRWWISPLAALACLASSALSLRLGLSAELCRASFALALAAQLLAAARFLSRRLAPDDAQRVALVLVASSFADAFGPWLQGEASRDWRIGTIPAVVTWVIVAGWEARCLIRSR